MTPEGRVKKNIRRVLESFEGVYFLMPVQMGLGAAGVDFHCVVKVAYAVSSVAYDGRVVVELMELPIAFFIEAKKPGDEPTSRQDRFLQDRREQQGCKTFVIDDDPSINHYSGGLEDLTKWLQDIEEHNERTRARFASADV